MAWQNSREDISDGWQGRIAAKVAFAAVAGATGGSVWGVLYGRSLLAGSAAVGGNCAMAAAGFAGLQEGCRKLRRDDNWPNSLLAGAGTGAIMGRAYRGPMYAPPAALAFAGAGLAAWHLDEYLVQSGLMRLALVQMDLLEATPEDIAAIKAASSKGEVPWYKRFEWPKWLPIRVMSEDELETINLEREFQRRLESVMEGSGKEKLLQYEDEILRRQALRDLREFRREEAREEEERRRKADAGGVHVGEAGAGDGGRKGEGMRGWFRLW